MASRLCEGGHRELIEVPLRCLPNGRLFFCPSDEGA